MRLIFLVVFTFLFSSHSLPLGHVKPNTTGKLTFLVCACVSVDVDDSNRRLDRKMAANSLNSNPILCLSCISFIKYGNSSLYPPFYRSKKKIKTVRISTELYPFWMVV